MKTAKHCGCALKVNELLAAQNGQIAASYRMMAGDIRAFAVIETEKVDTSRRGRLKRLVATFCPFCGVKYPEHKAPGPTKSKGTP